MTVNPIPDVFAISVTIPTDGEFPTAVTRVDPDEASLIIPAISVIISDLLWALSYIAGSLERFPVALSTPCTV